MYRNYCSINIVYYSLLYIVGKILGVMAILHNGTLHPILHYIVLYI